MRYVEADSNLTMMMMTRGVSQLPARSLFVALKFSLPLLLATTWCPCYNTHLLHPVKASQATAIVDVDNMYIYYW